jgi:hypothetical protein
MLGFNKFIQMCFDPAAIKYGYRPLIEVRVLGLYLRNSGPDYELRVPKSQFIHDRCERRMLAQLVVQYTAFDGCEHVSPRG